MENIKEIVKETVKKQQKIIERMKQETIKELEKLPLYNLFKIDHKYKVTIRDWMSSEEKTIYIIYKGIDIRYAVEAIKYIPLKKDLTEYKGNRGYIQDLSIVYIKNVEEVI